jgi:hypothetical protein
MPHKNTSTLNIRFSRVLTEKAGSGFGSNGKINKKRFKKQLKRIHCYFKKLSQAVEEDRRENDLMYRDLDL